MTKPICKDCKHSKWTGFTLMCYSPHQGVDSVYGTVDAASCTYQRFAGWPFYYISNTCGTTGRFFEPKD